MSAPGTARGVGHRDYGAGAVPVRPLRVSGEDSRAAFLPMLDQGRASAPLGLRRPAVGAAGGVDPIATAARRPASGGSATIASRCEVAEYVILVVEKGRDARRRGGEE